MPVLLTEPSKKGLFSLVVVAMVELVLADVDAGNFNAIADRRPEPKPGLGGKFAQKRNSAKSEVQNS